MKKKSYIILILLTSIFIVHIQDKVYTWWDTAHIEITAKAIEYLPEKWKTFFDYYKDFLCETCLWPDTVLKQMPGEEYNHYYDSEIPIERHIKNPKYGRLPWRISELMDKLTEYIIAEDWYKVLETAGILSHYLADSTMPYHTTVDYNPPLTSNISAPGVTPKHSLVEKIHAEHIHELLPAEIKINLTYIDDPFNFMFLMINESYSFIDELNSIVLGSNITDPKDDRDWPELKPLLQNRTIRAVWLVSSMWYTAIVNANALNKAPDPKKFATLKIFIQEFTVPQEIRGFNIKFRVKDLINVPIEPDKITAKINGYNLETRELGFGHYSIIIPSSIVEKLIGKNATLEINVYKENYGDEKVNIEISFSHLKKDNIERNNLTLYTMIIVILIAVIVGIIYINKRRRGVLNAHGT